VVKTLILVHSIRDAGMMAEEKANDKPDGTVQRMPDRSREVEVECNGVDAEKKLFEQTQTRLVKILMLVRIVIVVVLVVDNVYSSNAAITCPPADQDAA
jgi:hypothetical protein